MRLVGHRLTVTWNREHGPESASTGTCLCGWTESGSSGAVVRAEYHNHLSEAIREQHLFEARLRALTPAAGDPVLGECCSARLLPGEVCDACGKTYRPTPVPDENLSQALAEAIANIWAVDPVEEAVERARAMKRKEGR